MSGSSRLWLIFALALTVALVYWPSTAVLGEQWGDLANLTYTHGWLVLAVSVALVIRSRREISAAEGRPSSVAFVLLAACIFCWLICYRAAIQELHVMIFPAIFWLATSAAFGNAAARQLFFPVAFFYFSVPVWSHLSIPLEKLTVLAMRASLGITGPQADIHGTIVQTRNGAFAIEEGCSGLHYLIVGLAVAALHGELRRDRLTTRLPQLGLMAGLALLANWVRVYAVIEAADRSHMHSFLLRHHYWFGWAVFALALVIFFGLAARFEPAVPQPVATLPLRSALVPAITRQGLKGFGLAVLLLLALPAVSASLRLPLSRALPAPPLAADPGEPWLLVSFDSSSAWQPMFENADREQRLTFSNPRGGTVEAFSVTYRTQTQHAKLVGMHSSIAGRGLSVDSGATVATGAGKFRESRAVERERVDRVSLIWSRYETAGGEFVSPYMAQLWYGLKATLSSPSASLVALRAECRPDCAAARRVLTGFVATGAVR